MRTPAGWMTVAFIEECVRPPTPACSSSIGRPIYSIHVDSIKSKKNNAIIVMGFYSCMISHCSLLFSCRPYH
jgi:hypothetical protein